MCANVAKRDKGVGGVELRIIHNVTFEQPHLSQISVVSWLQGIQDHGKNKLQRKYIAHSSPDHRPPSLEIINTVSTPVLVHCEELSVNHLDDLKAT